MKMSITQYFLEYKDLLAELEAPDEERRLYPPVPLADEEKEMPKDVEVDGGKDEYNDKWLLGLYDGDDV